MDYGIQNKTVLVTAASQGIGEAAATALLAEGCNVAICSRSKDKLEEASAEMKNKFGKEPFWLVCELNNPKDIENTVKTVTEKLGSIEILVNNCGGPVPEFFNELNESDWENAYN